MKISSNICHAVQRAEAECYYELQICINPEVEDVISSMCFENLDCEGIVMAEETYKDLEMISTTEGTLRVFVKADKNAGIQNEKYIEAVLLNIFDTLKSYGLSGDECGSLDYKIIKVENQDWSKKWKENWDITKVTDRIVVVPDWIEYSPKPDDIMIRLEPGCAFGTGTHQTTQLCMKAIEKYMSKNAKVADIGMGSGILGICAKKFGASYVYGCDNDETVIDVAKENALKNNEECTFELNTADKINEKFDFVCANILHNVLFEIMEDLKHIMNDNAYMSLSGILDEKKQVVLEAISRCDLSIIEEIHQDQWTSFVVRK